MMTTASPPRQPTRFRFMGWILFLTGWIGFAYSVPEAWLKQFDSGLVAWKLLTGCMLLAGCALLLSAKSWPVWLKLLALVVFGSLLGLSVYYTYQVQLAQQVIDAYMQSRSAR